MTTRTVLAAVAVLLAGVTHGVMGQAPPASTPIFAIHTSVSVDGQPARDLSSADFTLLEANVRQQIAAASAAQVPLDVSLVVPEFRRRRFETVETFDEEVAAVAQSLEPKDRLRVVFAGDDQREQPLPLQRSLERSAFRNRTCIPVYDALARVLMKPSEAGRQHIVILITTTEGTGSVLSAETVAEIAKRSSARLQVVAVDERDGRFGRYDAAAPRCTSADSDWSPERRDRQKHIDRAPSSDQRDRELWLEGRRHLVDLAKLTGGGEIQPTLLRASRLDPLRKALDELRDGYILSYTPAGVPSTGWRAIGVTINRAGDYEVRARPGVTR